MTVKQSQFLHPAALALIALLLQGCGSAPPQDKSAGTSTTQSTFKNQTSETNVQLPPSQFHPQFAEADEALRQLDWMTASTVLALLDEEALTRNDRDYRDYLLARIDYVRGDQVQASTRLKALDRPEVALGIAYRSYNFQRHLLSLQRAYLDSARLGVRIMEIAPAKDLPGLKRSLWHDLQRSPESEIAQARSSAADPTWLGWLELANIANDNATTLSTALPRWQVNYPGHPAASPLPGGLEYMLEPAVTPQQVALVLPLSGRLAPAGKAIRDGYLAHYFTARDKGDAPTEVKVIDSDLYGSATEAYTAAVQQGAQLVVGPLSKASVAELAKQTNRVVPTIALNRIDQPVATSTTALVQLSLAPADEARQLAHLAFGEGGRRALVLRPAGRWGDEMESALDEQWRALGGTTTQVISYTGKDDYSSSVKSGLGIEASEQRRRKLRDMLAINLEFTPRRRADLDTVFMLSRTPEEARAIKPLLAFHYAGALPVYASSSAYGARDDSRNQDLNGTTIVELPWLLGSNPALQQSLVGANSDYYTRLNALGADAYLLQSRLVQLQAGPDALIRGDTGLLTMNSQLQIVRELPPARFDGDRLKSL
ncbi:MAG: penicillin-binding protein activator [Halieaceae bacterium]|nr:penicillin-binding protein activator [Halieaceae bacterium]